MAPSPRRPAERPVRMRPERELTPKIRIVGRARASYDDFYHVVLTLTWWRFFLVVGALFVIVNLAFAALFAVVPGSIAGSDGSFAEAFFFSVQTLGTIGYGAMAPANRYAHSIVTIESFVGLLTTALVTGATFARFARPTAKVLFSDKICLSRRDGVPYLVFRMANFRHNRVVEASVRAFILVNETTREGEPIRRPYDLRLVRERSPMFLLTFLAMHRIDEASPFHGADALEDLRKKNADILVTISALDDTIGQTIHARHAYALDQIVENVRFADVVTVSEDGTRVLDYANFDRLIDLPPATATADGAAS